MKLFKNYLLLFFIFTSSLYSAYITEDKIQKDKKSYQVSTCQSIDCIEKTHQELEKYSYITSVDDDYYVTYIVNIESENKDTIKNDLEDKFPDMMFVHENAINRELKFLNAYHDDFSKYKDKTVQAKEEQESLYFYAQPKKSSKIIAEQFSQENIQIDGCNINNWCKIKNKNSYILLNNVIFVKKQTKIIPKEPIKTEEKIQEKTENEKFIDKYKTALSHFKKKNYQISYILFNELFEKKQNDLNINFYLGRSAYESKNYDESVSAYERFLFEEPENNRVKLEMARAFYMTKSYKSSKKLLLDVKKDHSITKETLNVVNHYLALIDDKISKHSFGGVLLGSLIYDSNYGSQDLENTNNYVPTTTVSDDSVWYHQEIAILNYKYELNDKANIKQDFMVFNKQSFKSKTNDRDIQLLSLTPAISFNHTKKLDISYALYFDYLRYAKKSTLKTFALYPQLSYKINKQNTLKSHIKYQSKYNMQQSSKKNDSKYIETSFSLKHKYNKKITITPKMTTMKENANNSSAHEISYSGYKFGISLNYIINPTLFLTPSYTYTYSEYKDFDTVLSIQKEKKNSKFQLSSTYIYSPKFIVKGDADYIHQNSNIIKDEYEKYSFTLNLIRPF